MKIVRFTVGNRTRYGILEGKSIRSLASDPLISIKDGGEQYSLDRVRLLSPCLPSKIVALGLNYRSHARELNQKLPEVPLLFLKPSTAVIGPEDSIVYPSMSERVDYEGELGVVIGKRASKVPAGAALSYALGYTCFNDVTARDLQNRDGQWTRAKGFDTFAAIGPCIETELAPSNVELKTVLNGVVKQEGNTSDLVFAVPEIISFVSCVMTLLPGDVIATGTPFGIGPMQPGDTVEVVIPPIGTLRNRVAHEARRATCEE